MKKIAQEKNVSIGILLDLQGPEIRIDLPEEKPFDLLEGETCTFTYNLNLPAIKKVIIPKNVVETLQSGNVVLLDDGACELEVTEKNAGFLILKALASCNVKHRKTMNVPGVTVDMPALVDADYQQLDGATGSQQIDFVGLSFVRDRKDIDFLRQELNKRDIKAQIIAKIETQAALDNLAEIIDASDAVMVARGDLGVEMPYEELVYWQKHIIELCRLNAKPVITATQMLKSMTENPRPTRAEVSDVAHAIYDGTDAIMLSEETTIGKYPIKAVVTQSKIATYNEKYANTEIAVEPTDDTEEAIANNAILLTEMSGLKFDKIINMTISGKSARYLGRLHPSLPIISVTNNIHTYFELSLVYGVTPVLISKDIGAKFLKSVAELTKRGIVAKGERLLITHGIPNQVGGTNTISVLTVE
jgi:pyruvate kinase